MDAHNDRVEFYSAKEGIPYREFSNFYPVKFTTRREDSAIDSWQTTEHYFQAYKFTPGGPDFLAVKNAPTAMDAATLGRDRKRPLREDWEMVKEDVMLTALRLKFAQEPFRSILLGTGDVTIVEHTRNDSYWGDGGDGSGKNRLGELLMVVRSELSREE